MRTIDKMTIFKNKRVEENDFTMENPCTYCNSFVTQVLEINFALGVTICKGCLCKMIKRLDDEMVNSFQPDFTASQIKSEQEMQRELEKYNFGIPLREGL